MAKNQDENITDDEREAAEKEAQRLARLVEIDDLKWQMRSPKGRRLMARLLEQTGVYRSSFVSPNAMQVSFLEGQRNIGLKWISEISEHCPEVLNLMMMEQHTNAKRSGRNNGSDHND